MSLDRTERTELPEHESGIKRAVDKGVRAEKPGQESQKDRQDSTARIKDQTAWTGEPGQNREDKSGHESKARTAASGKHWTRLLGQDSWHRPAGIGQPGQDSQIRQSGLYIQDRKQKTILS